MAVEPPRRLRSTERALLDFLLDHPLARDELRAQAANMVVDGRCSCGCPSIVLRGDPKAPRARYKKTEAPTKRTDWVPLEATTARGGSIVTLHVLNGRLYELEIWKTFIDPENKPEARRRIRVPAPERLAYVTE